MTKRLRACEGCARHVFVTERVCPFCFSELEPAPERATLPIPSSASRAQRLALAAALGSQGLLACAQTTESASPEVSAPDGAPVAGASGTIWDPKAGYAAPPPAGRSGSFDAGVATPVYGVPLAGSPGPAAGSGGNGGDTGVAGQPAPQPDEDGGADESAAGSGGRSGVPVPPYGIPPSPPPDE